jgi:hypothetical protein
MNSDQGYIAAITTPFVFAGIAAIYSYLDFASNGITSPSIWVATFLAAFFTFVIVFFICMAIFVWRYT